MTAPLRAPFPYQGGKSKAAAIVWPRFGRAIQYSEPFCGSLAMLFGAPRIHQLEVVNDNNCLLANFWRAVQYQADAVWSHADQPVVQVEMGARHTYLMDEQLHTMLRESLRDPLWSGDARSAGWWVWGQCATINHWCERAHNFGQIPAISRPGQGINARSFEGLPRFSALRERLRNVRVLCADWSSCTSFSQATLVNGIAAQFFDPPYKAYTDGYMDRSEVAADVEEYCLAHGDNPRLRIALCGHIGDYDLPGWDVMPWKRTGATFGGSTKTQAKEAIWFSPACLPAEPIQGGLFA